MQATRSISIDSPEVRRAGREVLSLALMDARNHTLHLAGQLEAALGEHLDVGDLPGIVSPLWTLGHIGWFQEWWVLRNLQRQRGSHCDPGAVRLASLDTLADVWYNPALNGALNPSISGPAKFRQPPQARGRDQVPLPDLAGVKRYLLETLEATLELLEKSPEDDEALYFYRLALLHEDGQGEALIELAQALGVALALPLPGGTSAREPLRVPAARWSLGLALSDGFAFDNERPVQLVQVPDFEIDAQPVTWAQFVEFVDDGGYDRTELWHADGWKWLAEKAADASEHGGRRGPRYVDQIGVASGAVMQTRFGKPMRMLGSQSATHVTWWEADAWARWAGRRLPAEVEWEVAAHTAARQGFRWGDVWEWTGTTFRGYPGFAPGPWADYSAPHFGSHKVLRGASFASRARMKNPKFRGFALPDRDEMFCGFRSCAL